MGGSGRGLGGGEQHNNKKKKTFKLLILQTMFTFVIKKRKEEPCKKRFQHQSLFQTCDDVAGWTLMTMQQRNLIPVSPTRSSGTSTHPHPYSKKTTVWWQTSAQTLQTKTTLRGRDEELKKKKKRHWLIFAGMVDDKRAEKEGKKKGKVKPS